MLSKIRVDSYINDLDKVENLAEAEKMALKPVTDKYRFRANEYYLSLIDWEDPEDPISRIIIPSSEELEQWGRLDPSDEQVYCKVAGLEHKYNSTALLLVSDVCGGICRYCFRKRVFMDNEREFDLEGSLDYIKSHREINNVLLTGGDPLVLSTSRLEKIISRLREIDHVNIIRIGTRMPVFNPYRIIEDAGLLDMIGQYSYKDKKIYIMTHFDHPRELTDVAVRGIDLLQQSEAIITNQMPLIKGVNDDPDVIAELFSKLSYIGVAPYYVFQCRPAVGNRAYTVPIEQGYEIFESAKSRVSGLAKRARFVMSHSTGKIEIVGKTEGFIYLKYLRAAEDCDSSRFLVFKSNPQACWFDDYDEIIQDYPIEKPYRFYGPE